jgi:hypothetical protein
MTLRYDFEQYSPGSRTLADYEALDCAAADETGAAFGHPRGRALLIAECERTAAAVEAAAPARIAKGSQTKEEADRLAAIFRAIAADIAAELAHYQAHWRHLEAGGSFDNGPALGLPRPSDAFGWEEKVHALRRELHFRRRYDADRIAKGRITAASAAEQLERLEAVQDKYFYWLFTWNSPGGHAVNSPAFRAEIRQHSEMLHAAAAARRAAAAEQPEPELQEAMPL